MSLKKEYYLALVAFAIGIGIVFLAQARPNVSLATESAGLTTVIRTNSSHTAGYYGLAQVSCDQGEALTGGGYYSSQWHESLSVYRNGPSEDGKKWIVEMIYYTPHYYGKTPTFTIYAICARTTQ